MRRGLTLAELIMVVMLYVILAAVTVYVFRAVLLGWSSQEESAGIDITLDRAMEEMARDLREASAVQSADGYDEIRWTQDGADYYIYYFYNQDDAYTPPPAFDEDSYELRKAELAGGIGGAFTYGDGKIIISDCAPPPASDLSFDGTALTVDLTVTRKSETLRARTEIKPRNL